MRASPTPVRSRRDAPASGRSRRLSLAAAILLVALLAPACSRAVTPTDPGGGGDRGGGDGGGGNDSSAVVQPDDPGSADVRFTIDATKTTPISPWIYGVNAMTEDRQPAGYAPWYGATLPRVFTLDRAGGNRWSAYNWENNYSNAGLDYGPFSNDAYLSSSRTPGEAVRSRAAAAFARGAGMLVTVPMLDYVAADGNGPTGADEASRATRLATRFRRSLPRKSATFTLSPNAGDSVVYQDEFVHWLGATFPGHGADTSTPIFFSLDNEPDIWFSTHEEVESKIDGKPRLQTYDGFSDRTIAYASAVKDAAPGAVIFGPAVATYTGIATLGRYPTPDPTYGTRSFLDVYLDRLHAEEQRQGRRLVDVLDIHWYPAAGSGGREISDDRAPQDDAMITARLQAPRSLWDPTYDEGSWVNDAQPDTRPIALLPKLRAHIASHDPGMKIAISEYYYGRGGDISGGLAQADVLGIFGREGVFAATLWPQADVSASPYGGSGSKAYAYIFGAFDLFRNYDGNGATVGDLEAHATTSNAAKASVYATVDRQGRTVLVAINKTSAPLTAAIAITGPLATTASIYTMASGAPTPGRKADVSLTKRNALVLTLPSLSASTIVMH